MRSDGQVVRSAAATTRLVFLMQESLAAALRDRRPETRQHWETLLRTEPVATPLGHPDSLVHLIDWSLDEIYSAISHPLTEQHADRHRQKDHGPPDCACGGNPLLRYFAAGRQAMREALVLSQAARPSLDPLERDASFDELNLVLDEISRRELGAFCSVCGWREPGAAPAVASTGRPPERFDGV